MKISIQKSNSAVIISIQGSIEMRYIKKFKSHLLDIVKNEEKDIELNLSEANYIDSTGIALLLKIYKIQKKKGKNIKLVEVSPGIMSTLELSNVIDLFGPLSIPCG